MVRCGHIIAACFVQLLQLAVGLTVATAMSFCVCAVCVTHLRVCVLSGNIYRQMNLYIVIAINLALYSLSLNLQFCS